jgi:hypothetical protein
MVVAGLLSADRRILLSQSDSPREDAAAKLAQLLSPAAVDALLADAEASGVPIDGPDGLLSQMTKAVLERALDVEITDHLGYEHGDPVGHGSGNSRNGPRNTRPRDSLGRLLPPGSKGVPCIPDDLELPPTQSLAYAQGLLNRGMAFNAHEVLEAAWKNGPDDERALWQGLTQLAVGITHVQRGNLGGATTLLRRGSGHLGEVDHPAPYSVDVDGLVGWAAALVDDLAAGAEISPPRLRPALTKP